jgi:hypothetical protein
VPNDECRVSFGVATAEQIPEGIRRLRQAVAAIGSKGQPRRVAAGV